MIQFNNKIQLGVLRERIDQALAPLAKELGITIETGNCRFTERFAKFDIHLTASGRQDELNAQAADSFASLFCPLPRARSRSAD